MFDWQRRMFMRRTLGPEQFTLGLHTREKWPEGLPVYGVFTVVPDEGSWASTFRFDIFATPRLDRTRTLEFTTPRSGTRAMSSSFSQVPIGIMPGGVEHIDVDIEATWRVGGSRAPLWKITHQVPASSVATIDDAIRPLSDPAIDKLIKRELVISIGRYGSLWTRWRSYLAPLGGVTVAVRLEVIADGEVVGTGVSRWTSPGRTTGAMQPRIAMPSFLTPDENWSVRIVADPELALADPDCTVYWLGEVTVPLVTR
jgi:hypothetical protein